MDGKLLNENVSFDEENIFLKNSNIENIVNYIPDSIKDKYTFLEYFKMIFCIKIKLLNQSEIKIFNKLVYINEIGFNINNKNHLTKLNTLYFSLFDSNSEDILNDIKWKEFGFQTEYPHHDFRGGGILSLNCIIYLVDNYKNDVKNIMDFSKEKFFLWAVSSINTTFYLKKLFHFGVFNNYIKNIDSKITLNKIGLINFFKFYKENKKIFFILNSIFLLDLFKIWKFNVEKNNINLVYFGQAENIVNKKFKFLFEQKIYNNFDDFLIEFNKYKNPEINPKFKIN